MIKTIIMQSCSPYLQEQVDDCRKINFIYGSNGSGKSTISSFLADPSAQRFAHSSVVWDNTGKETICVYNREFREKNFQQEIPGVFTMGSATINEIEALKKDKRDLEDKQKEYGRHEQTYLKQINEVIPNCENRFKEDAWTRILKGNEEIFREAFEGFRRSKDKFVEELKKRIKGVHNHSGNVTEKADLQERAKTLFQTNTEKCTRFTPSFDQLKDQIEKIEGDVIWNTAIVGNEDIDISGLIKELENSSWVDQGRKYMIAESKTCPFCQQETITDAFRRNIELFFDKGYEQQVERMRKLRDEYSSAVASVLESIEKAIEDEKSVNIGKIDVEVLLTKSQVVRAQMKNCVQLITDKISFPEKRITIPSIMNAICEIQKVFAEANDRIDEYNNMIAHRDDEKKRLIDDIWTTLIDEESPMITSYQKEIARLKAGAQGMKQKLEERKKTIKKLEESIVENGTKITGVGSAIVEINRSLKAYGFTGFSICPANGKKNYYCIKRDDGSLVENTLSEGEETFLSFLYFMQWTKGSIDPNHVSDKKIIVLDDPICSLDSNVLYVVSAMIKDLSRQIINNTSDVSQLFVLTHNVFFHKEASFDPRNAMGNNANFWIIRKDNDSSTIINCGQKNPITTSYELLWAELRENKKISKISVQNIMRRIIENYFGILGKGIDESLVSSFETLEEQVIARSLLNWINDGSHSIPDDIYIDSYTDAVPKYMAVFREIFLKSNHISHYNMMMKIDTEMQEAN